MRKSKLEWAYNRLLSMSFREILHRFFNVIKVICEKKQILKSQNKIKLIKKINNYYFDNLDHIIDYYSSNKDLKNKLFINAQKILKHEVSIFSLKNFNLGDKIDWHKDYSSGKIYPKLFYSDVNLEMADVKYTWELNRFQHLFPLAQAYALSNEEKYASEILSQITDWIDENPYMTGVNWVSSLELSLRLISWSWCLFSLNQKQYKIPDDVQEKISTSIYQQTEFIFNHLSAYSSANDHLIGEAMGLTIIGTSFDFGNDSIRWQKKGMRILFEELDKQVFDDGLDKEQAFGYHCFVFNMFLTTFILLKKNNINIPNKYWLKLEKMADCIMNFSDNNLNLPDFGDGDDSFILKLDNCYDNGLPIQSVARFLLNTSSILFERSDFKGLTNVFLDEETLWLMDKNHINSYFSSPAVIPVRTSIYYPESGYVILKDKNIDAFVDVGSVGYLSIAAHGHSDALSFCLNFKGKKYLIDPGTFSYNSQQGWRNYFRSTKAHNTVDVDGQNQSQIGGSFMWMQKAETVVEDVVINEKFDYVRASHNGYLKQKIPVTHQRELLFMKDKFVLVIDRLKNKKSNSHKFCLHWHTDTNCFTELNSELNLYKITNQQDSIFVKTFGDTEIEQKIINGSENPILGWASKSFDSKSPSQTIEVTFTSSDSPTIVSVIYFNESLKLNYSDNKLKINDGEQIYDYNLRYFLDL